MKKVIKILIIFLLWVLPLNIVQASKVSPESLKQMQTYYYDTGDCQKVLRAVVSTLYESDFIIEEYDDTINFVRAKKTFKARYTNKKRVAGWSAVLAAAGAYTVFSYGATAATMYSPSRRIATEMKDKTVIVDANVFVEQIEENKTRVRFIPVEKVMQNADGFSFMKSYPIKIFRIYKPDAYNEFFNQVAQKLVI